MPGGVHENMRAWDPEEDRLIIEMLSEHGPRWSMIVKRLPGRTISSVRNRWQRIDKGRRMAEAGTESKNRCQWCGQPKRGHVCFARMAPRTSTPTNTDAAFDVDLSDAVEKDAASPSSASTPKQPQRQPSADDAALADVLPDVSELDDEDDELEERFWSRVPGDGEDDASQAHQAEAEAVAEPPPVPMICRMKSGARICGELGFEETVSAASTLDDEPEVPVVVPISRRADSERSVRSEAPELLSPSRMPSLRTLAPTLS